MISEAGAGKTHECRNQAQRLWGSGEPAFFIEMAALATGDLRSLLDDDEEARLDAWLSSQSDVATFFLDSIDELKLTLGSFEQALKRLKKGIGSQLSRARIVITTRPTAFDEQLMRRVLPVPPELSSEPEWRNLREDCNARSPDPARRGQGRCRRSRLANGRVDAAIGRTDCRIREGSRCRRCCGVVGRLGETERAGIRAAPAGPDRTMRRLARTQSYPNSSRSSGGQCAREAAVTGRQTRTRRAVRRQSH